ncbi:TetR/AcrR family transcriptional regulator C-terminal domain-containing protein [Brachyspira catarrhinii]|uniref:TetR family transcriptional regulator n=1 Tax=Brachyspira catarrhinii TaxID=2528966 RepID=A0ABY2TT64_9SPIR|nr:TetR/AcrR family transcriptional regulator C-terminal domain-containing protein [Brachyspira catarrhinii]TKZ35925.1 TetR family transcriptional regulator [Brachyspira catarrhinii]
MKNRSKKNNLKIKETQKLLEDSLGALLEEKSFEEIRVMDICSKANIHRSTFYTYYNDKYELLKSKLDKYEAKFLEFLRKYKIEGKLVDSHVDIMIEILKYFYFNKKYLKVIFQNNREGSIIKILQKYLEAYIIEGVKDMKQIRSGRPYMVEIMGSFYSGAFISVIGEWILKDCYITPEELSQYISDIIMQKVFL